MKTKNGDNESRLTKLEDLYRSGNLTEEEFLGLKQKIVDESNKVDQAEIGNIKDKKIDNKRTKKGFLYFFSWILGLVLLMAALGVVFEHQYFLGAMLIICSLLIIPSICNIIEKYLHLRTGKWIKISAFILYLIVISFTANTTHRNSDTTTPKENGNKIYESIKPDKPDLEVIDSRNESGDFGTRYIVGTVKNNTNKKYGYVQIEFNLYDDSGAQVGSTLDNVNNLEANGTWKFKAMILEDRATKYKLAGITGF